MQSPVLDYGREPLRRNRVFVWLGRALLAIVLIFFAFVFVVWAFDLGPPRDTEAVVDGFKLAPGLANYNKQYGVLPPTPSAIKFRSRFEWKFTNQPKTSLRIIAFARIGYNRMQIVYIDDSFQNDIIGGDWVKEHIDDIEAGSIPFK